MWFMTLIILAVAAYFLIKFLTGKASQQDSRASLEHSQDTANRLDSTGTAANPSASANLDSTTVDGSGSFHSSSAAASGAAVVAGATVGGALNSSNSGSSKPGSSNSLADLSVDTGNLQQDVQEMIKILNLAPSDASRLSLSRDAFTALRAGDNANAPSEDKLNIAADKLRQMLA